MSLSIADRRIQQAASLSLPSRLCLGLVDGGLPWLQWALSSSNHHYAVADETQLLQSVQQGLHGTPLCLLPASALLVSPVKLMTFSSDELQTLTALEAQGVGSLDPVLANQRQALCSRHDLVDLPTLQALQAWLGQLGVAQAPVLQSLSLRDAIPLVDLMRQAPTLAASDPAAPATPNAGLVAAAAFAAEQARSPAEFGDYLRFYQHMDASGQADRAQDTLHQVLPQVFGALDCPQLSGLPSPALVMRVVKDWYARGRQLGFARASLAALRVVQHQGSGDVATTLWQLTTTAQAFLSATPQVQALLGQDGQSATYTLTQGLQTARLQLDAQGVVSLDDCLTQAPGTEAWPPTTT